MGYKRNSAILVDGMNLVFRAHYAHRSLRSRKGRPTSVLFGFLKTLPQIEHAYPDCKIVVAWESGQSSDPKAVLWRKQRFRAYKGNREKNQDTEVALSQLPTLRRALEILKYPQVACPELEADDLMGILSRVMHGDVLLYSTDEDLYQLITDRVAILRPSKTARNRFQQIGPQHVQKQYGVTPDKFVLLKALMGDTSDNYKPYKGIGPKKALQMLRDGLRPNIPQWERQAKLSRFKYDYLEKYWKNFYICYQLAMIPTTVDDTRLSPECRGVVAAMVEHARHYSGRFAVSDADKVLRVRRFGNFCQAHSLGSFAGSTGKFFATMKVRKP